MLFELVKRIREEFTSSRFELISQIAISDDEYEELLQYVRDKVKNSYVQMLVPSDEVLSVAMVQIAIRVYSEGNYWDYFDEEVGVEISQGKKYYFAQIFAKTIQKYKLFELEQENQSKYSYVENIKAHAFVPNQYLHNYFDFLFSFYDRNLFRQLTDEIDEDIDDLIGFVSESLSRSGDVVSIEKSGNKPAKSYKLLKATRALIAQSTSTVVSDTFFDHLVLMDNYYYDGKLPPKADRFSEAFQEWVEKKNSEINASDSISRKRKAKESFFHKPHFLIDRNNSQLYLMIPSQKFRTEGFVNDAKVEIRVGGELITKHLEVYKAYGVLVSEEIKLPITDLFAEYKVIISANATQEYLIPSKEYRVFDEDFDENSKLKKGTNYLLVQKGLYVSGNITERFVNTACDLWDEYCYDDVSENSVIYINGKPLSLIGEFSDKPLFECVSKEYLLYKNGRQVQTAYKHPIVSFKINKGMLPRTRLFVNEDPYSIENDCNITVFDFPNEKDVVGVSIDLDMLLPCMDGVYQISLDEPGKNPHLLTRYILITELRCRTSKPRYTFCSTAEIKLSGDYLTNPLNCYMNEYGEYVVNLLEGNEAGEFELEFQKEIYKLLVPLRVFKFGFEKQWQLIRPEFLWYSDLKNELYVSIPGATDVKVYLNKNESDCIWGDMYEDGKFKLDISEFVAEIKETTSSMVYINLMFCDNRWRSISLYRVQVRPWIDRFALICENGAMALDAKYQSRNPLYVEFYDFDTKELVVGTQLENGITYLPQISRDKLYTLKRYEVESDEFGFDDNYIPLGEPLHKYGNVDVSDLSNCKMFITRILNKERGLKQQYTYVVFDIQKETDNVYFGKLMYSPKVKGGAPKQKPRTLFEKVRFEVVLDESKIQVLSLNIIEDEDAFIPYYDSTAQVLISENSDILLRSREFKRYIPLYEDETTYYVDFRRVK